MPVLYRHPKPFLEWMMGKSWKAGHRPIDKKDIEGLERNTKSLITHLRHIVTKSARNGKHRRSGQLAYLGVTEFERVTKQPKQNV